MPKEAFERLWVSTVSMIRPGHDEGAVLHPLDLLDARADGGAEDDEVERGRDHRRDEALQEGAEGPRHLAAVDRPDAAPVHARFPHQADEDVLERVLPGLHVLEHEPAAERSRSSEVMPVRCAAVS